MKALLAGFVVLGVIALAGCNTVHGIGQDLEKAGEAVQKSAK